ncbi:NADH-quinone oxidoreductase subunit J [bacterium]|nr:NADH-quinone oxidoreductase subunit J [bacterium]
MTETITTALFYIFAASAVLLAFALVLTRRILRAAVWLMGVLFCSAAFYVLLGAEFLAGIQVLVYIGGIVVLLVFAIMLTSSFELLDDHPSALRRILGILTAGGFFAVTALALLSTKFPVKAYHGEAISDVEKIGKSLLNYGPGGYVLPFEVISVLLLAALIGGIVVARKVLVKDPEAKS